MQDKPKFFGRRQGRKLHKAKSFLLEVFLPQIHINLQQKIDIKKCFPVVKKKYCLEIGFGDGEHIAELARREPDVGFVGIEVYKNGVANLLTIITGIKNGTEADLAQEIKLQANREDNIRVFDDDARLLFSSLLDASFDKIYLLFPDPWPKTKHAGRRFVNPENLKELARVLKKGGILQIATDHPVYKKWTLDIMHQNKDFVWTAKCSNDWRNSPKDWCETKYQRKAIREGRRPVFFEFERI